MTWELSKCAQFHQACDTYGKSSQNNGKKKTATGTHTDMQPVRTSNILREEDSTQAMRRQETSSPKHLL